MNYKKMLDALGYEYKMVYVNASLDNAQKRNEKRSRKLPPEIVKSDWDNAQKNGIKNLIRFLIKIIRKEIQLKLKKIRKV